MSAGFVRNLRRYLPKRERPTQRVALFLAVTALVLGTLLSIIDNNTEIKVAGVVIIVVVLSSLILSMIGMLIEMAVVALCLVAVFAVHGLNEKQLSLSGFVMIFATSLVGVLQARRRDALGLREVSAETVIGLIRDRLLVQNQLPIVPDGWTVEIQQRPADGAAISGDFVSTRLVCTGDQQVLHLVVVDVSGNGIAAGPRALLLSGAVGGLLGSVPPEEFLNAANAYLTRQQWSLGFASAIYVRLDLRNGEYTVRVAGHPPAMHFKPQQAPPWHSAKASGTVLGVLPDLAGTVASDVIQPGEAVFLYTDGVIEDRSRDLDAGSLRFKESVELLAARNDWIGVASYLIERVPTLQDDDRTVVMIRRNPVPATVPAADRPRGAGVHATASDTASA